jgi:hypothetical protein
MAFMDSNCTYVEQYKDGEQTYEFTGHCIDCGEKKTVSVPGPELFAYQQGGYIQKAMTSVSAGDREFLLSGICGSCFDKMFRRDES